MAIVTLKRKGVVFTEAMFAADVEYRAWTQDRKLRHPSFKGVKQRDDGLPILLLDGDLDEPT